MLLLLAAAARRSDAFLSVKFETLLLKNIYTMTINTTLAFQEPLKAST